MKIQGILTILLFNSIPMLSQIVGNHKKKYFNGGMIEITVQSKINKKKTTQLLKPGFTI